jgi:hypothetical protein
MSKHIIEAEDGSRHIIEFDDPTSAPAPEASSKTDRFLTGLADPVIGAAQIADKYLVNPIRQKISPGASSMEDVTRQRDAEYVKPEGVDWMRMAGNVANPMTYATRGRGLPNAMAQAGFQSVLDPTKADLSGGDFALEKLKQAGLGATIGGVGHKVFHGATSTPEAQRLMAQGIQPTVGQAKGGVANRIEEKLSSMPFVGEQVATARRRPLDEFQQVVLDQAAGARGVRDVRHANQIASNKFEDVVPHLDAGMPTLQLVGNQLAQSQQNPRLNNEAKGQLAGIVSSIFDQFHATGPRDLKHIDAVLGEDIRRYSTSMSVSEREMGRELQSIRDAFRQGLAQESTGNNVGGRLMDANATYARLVPINKAASANAEERIFPRALEKALARQQGRDVTRARPNQLVSDAVDVLPNKVPDSGTAGRMNMTNLLKTAYSLPIAALTWLPSTRAGQAAMLGNTAAQRAAAPYSGNLSQAYAAGLRGND